MLDEEEGSRQAFLCPVMWSLGRNGVTERHKCGWGIREEISGEDPGCPGAKPTGGSGFSFLTLAQLGQAKSCHTELHTQHPPL